MHTHYTVDHISFIFLKDQHGASQQQKILIHLYPIQTLPHLFYHIEMYNTQHNRMPIHRIVD
jgi:hypothetical protein